MFFQMLRYKKEWSIILIVLFSSPCLIHGSESDDDELLFSMGTVDSTFYADLNTWNSQASLFEKRHMKNRIVSNLVAILPPKIDDSETRYKGLSDAINNLNEDGRGMQLLDDAQWRKELESLYKGVRGFDSNALQFSAIEPTIVHPMDNLINISKQNSYQPAMSIIQVEVADRPLNVKKINNVGPFYATKLLLTANKAKRKKRRNKFVVNQRSNSTFIDANVGKRPFLVNIRYAATLNETKKPKKLSLSCESDLLPIEGLQKKTFKNYTLQSPLKLMPQPSVFNKIYHYFTGRWF